MKNIKLNFILIVLSVVIISCSKIVDKDKLQTRNAIAYELNSEMPFSGKAVEYYGNGRKKSEMNYVNGKLHGKEIFWKDDGAKSIVVEHDTTRFINVVYEYDEEGKEKGPSFALSDPGSFWKKLLTMPNMRKEDLDKEFALPENRIYFYPFILSDYNKPSIGIAIVHARGNEFTIDFDTSLEYQTDLALKECSYILFEAPKDMYYKVYRNKELKRKASLGRGLSYGQMLLNIYAEKE